MHSAQAENSIYHSYSNEFPLRWQLQPHHVRKSSQPLPFKEHTRFTHRKRGLRIGFPFSPQLHNEKICHFLLFQKLRKLKGKGIWIIFLLFFSTTQIAVSFAKMCIGLRWAEGVFATFLVSLPLLCCQGNWTVASALCPTPAAARTMLSLHDATDAKDQSLHFGGFVWK